MSLTKRTILLYDTDKSKLFTVEWREETDGVYSSGYDADPAF